MNYHDIQTELYKLIDTKTYGFYKREAYYHLTQVATLCRILAIKRGLDSDIAAVIGLYHDISTYINMNSFQHALQSSLIASQHLTIEEKDIIVEAIKNHSDKSLIQDPYSELIKDADVLSHVLEGQVLSEEATIRYTKLKQEINL